MKKSKIIFAIGFLASSFYANAQMTIGNPNNASANKTSVLLDFEKTGNTGIQLPIVTTLPTNAVDGTLLVDGTTSGGGRIKIRQNNTWVDLSTVNGNVTSVTSARTGLSENPNCYTSGVLDTNKCKVVLGASTSTADGVLVLESTSKAMVLPTVTDINNIKNPAPGMMAYVANTTTNKYMLAVYNGVSWAFWAAQ
jgi:hypothetical protein